MVPLPDNWRDGTPSKDEPFYYYRPWKTILTRTTADGGQSYFIQADHRVSIPNLWHALTQSEALELPDGVVAATESITNAALAPAGQSPSMGEL
jgi:hypothetical protein